MRGGPQADGVGGGQDVGHVNAPRRSRWSLWENVSTVFTDYESDSSNNLATQNFNDAAREKTLRLGASARDLRHARIACESDRGSASGHTALVSCPGTL